MCHTYTLVLTPIGVPIGIPINTYYNIDSYFPSTHLIYLIHGAPSDGFQGCESPVVLL